MPAFSFIHIADLHLDSPFCTLAGENTALSDIMKSATFSAYENIIRLAIEKRVDFIVIAGDVFDGIDRSLRAQIRFFDGLRLLSDAGIKSFIVHGNHDPLDSWSTGLERPSGAHIFSDLPETVHVKRGSEILASIEGISYPKRDERRNLAKMFKKTGPGFHIGLLHANVGSNTGHEPYAPCSMEDLRSAGMDYWALGHVHTRRRLLKSGPCILYPGNTQGRNITETGEKGCCLIRVDDAGGIETEFHTADAVRWYSLKKNIEGLEQEQDLIHLVQRTCEELSAEGAGRTSIARIILEGNSLLSNMLANRNTLRDLIEIARDKGSLLSPFVWVDKIESRARPALDLNILAKRDDFVGELVRFSRAFAENENPAALLHDDISALFDNIRAHKYLNKPDSRRLKELLDDALMICLRGLEAEDR